MQAIRPQQLRANILKLHRMTVKSIARVINLQRRRGAIRRALRSLRSRYVSLLSRGAAHVFFLLIAFLAYVLCAAIDASQSFILWEDIVDSSFGGAIIAAARICLAVLSSALLYEPFAPIMTRRSVESQGGGQSDQELDDASRAKWIYCTVGALLSTALVVMMWQATTLRVGLEIMAGLLPAHAGFQAVVPIAAVIVEILTGFALIEVFTMTVCHTRRSYLFAALLRSRRRRAQLMEQIERYLRVISSDQELLRSHGYEEADVQYSPQARSVIRMIDPQFGRKVDPTAAQIQDGNGHRPHATGEDVAYRIILRTQ